jgi:hypothetical protein
MDNPGVGLGRRVMNSRRLMGSPQSENRTLAHDCGNAVLCSTAKYAGQRLLGVTFVGLTRFRRSRDVRFAPIASEPSHRSDSTQCADIVAKVPNRQELIFCC